MNATLLDRQLSFTKHAELIHEAGKKGCELILFPELSLCGYVVDPAIVDAAAIPEGDLATLLEPLHAACRNAGLTAIVGAIVAEGERKFISALALDRLGKVRIYRKRHLHDLESAVFQAGESTGHVTVGEWKIGIGICFDGGFPSHAAELATEGSHVYALSALFGSTGGREESRAWLPDRARHNGIFAVLSNHVGPAGAWTGCGSAGAWSPDGQLLAEADNWTEGILVVELDPSLLVDRNDVALA